VKDEHYVSWDNRTYKNQHVSLDNARFVNCRFEGVTFRPMKFSQFPSPSKKRSALAGR